MEQLKCSSCHCFKCKEEFTKKGRSIKTCISCRQKSKIQRNTETIKGEIQNHPETIQEIYPETQTRSIVWKWNKTFTIQKMYWVNVRGTHFL